MKPLFYFFALFLAYSLNAQPFERTYLYVGFQGGYPLNLGIQATVFAPSGWGGVFAMNSYGFDNDKDPYTEQEFLEFDPYDGKDIVNAFSLRALKMFPTQSEYVRFGIEAGPSYVVWQFWENAYTMEEERTAGFSARTTVSFPLLKKCGLELGAQTNLNNKRSYFGIDATLNLGRVRGNPTFFFSPKE